MKARNLASQVVLAVKTHGVAVRKAGKQVNWQPAHLDSGPPAKFYPSLKSVVVLDQDSNRASHKQRLREETKSMLLSEQTSQSITERGLPFLVTAIVFLSLVPHLFAGDKQKDEDTLTQANIVLQDMLNSNSISPAVLSKADCVLILPGVKKVGFGVGGTGGRGPLLCREGKNFEGTWSAPAMYSIGGASVGLQIGGSSSDFVLLIMNPKVVNQILNGKTKMGTDASAAAGPTGATAASASDADILTYGRTKGLFAGVSLGGATVEPDNDANHRLYGKTLTATDIVRGTDVTPSGEGKPLVEALDSKIANHRN